VETMVNVIVNYELASSMTLERVRDYYEQAVPKFEQMPGLIRKYFMLSEDGKIGGSVYLWESRDLAVNFHNEEWMEFIRGKYGNRPSVTIFECPIIVDNVSGDVIIE
jgi:hypothetical protein